MGVQRRRTTSNCRRCRSQRVLGTPHRPLPSPTTPPLLHLHRTSRCTRTQSTLTPTSTLLRTLDPTSPPLPSRRINLGRLCSTDTMTSRATPASTTSSRLKLLRSSLALHLRMATLKTSSRTPRLDRRLSQTTTPLSLTPRLLQPLHLCRTRLRRDWREVISRRPSSGTQCSTGRDTILWRGVRMGRRRVEERREEEQRRRRDYQNLPLIHLTLSGSSHSLLFLGTMSDLG
jgi:hypothetical protein